MFFSNFFLLAFNLFSTENIRDARHPTNKGNRKQNEIKKDDIICFYSPDPLIYGLPNTHRVISEPKITENGIIFETRGDKNLIPDKHPVEEDMLIGVYVDDLPALSSFS